MSKPKLTPWFEARVKPARPGVYLATILMRSDLDDERGLYRYWDGRYWCKPATTPDEAMFPMNLHRAFLTVMHWRGRMSAPRNAGVPSGCIASDGGCNDGR